jgi:tetratricopeptide (TPR) repeat protein
MPQGTRTSRRRAGTSATPRSNSRLWIFLAGVFLLKLAVLLQLKDHVLTQADAGLDTTSYVGLAQRVVNGDLALGPGLYFVSPLYIYFLAMGLGLTGSLTAVRVAQIVLGTCAVGCVFVMTEEWFGRRAAWIAATLAALTGLFTFYESLILQTALDPFLTAAALSSLTFAFTRGGRRWFFLSGLAFGLETLNRPNIVVPALVIIAMVAFTVRVRLACVVLAGFVMAIAPVAIRNVAVAGEWAAIASHGGLNFYIGNNSAADGTYRAVPGITPNLEGQRDDTRKVAEQSSGRALSDAGVSNYFYGLGVSWIRSHPSTAARLFARKLAYVFAADGIWLNYSYRFFAEEGVATLRLLPVGSLLLTPLGLVGLVAAAPTLLRRQYIVWASFVPLYAAATAAFFVADRYALPLLVPLGVGAGAAADALVEAISSRARPKVLAIAAAACALLVIVAIARPSGLDGREEERTRMAERLVTLHRFEEADAWAARAASDSPRPGLIEFRVGQRLAAAGEVERAIVHFERAAEADPEALEVRFALGETLLDARRPRDAIVHLRKSLAAGIRRDVVGPDLVRAYGAAGDSRAALDVLRGLRPDRDDDASGWVGLGDLAMQLRDAALAEDFFRRAVSADADLAAAHFGLAAAAATLGHLADARREVEVALRLDPKSERARQLLGVLAQRAAEH